MAKATVGGAGQLAEDAAEDPAQLRINVTSPGGTTQAALVAGVPQIAIPLFSSDQFANAARLAEVGVGIALTDMALGIPEGAVVPNGPAAVDGLAEALAGILTNEDAQAASRALASEVRALPSATECVEALTAAPTAP